MTWEEWLCLWLGHDDHEALILPGRFCYRCGRYENDESPARIT